MATALASPTSPEVLEVRRARDVDVDGIVEIASVAFSGMRNPTLARSWVEANLHADPRMAYWVVEHAQRVLGYILWLEKGGFREEAVWELEQIAVDPRFRSRGVGSLLVRRSLEELERLLQARGARLACIEVTTGSEQSAVDFYRRTLGAEVVATVPGLFRGEEYILLARR